MGIHTKVRVIVIGDLALKMTVLRPWPWPVQTDLELWEQLVARWTVVLCVVRLCSLQNVVDVHLKAERVELSETRNRNDTRSLLAPHCVSQSHGVLPVCHGDTGSYLYVTVTRGPTCRSQWHRVLPGCHSDMGSYLDVTVTRGPTWMSVTRGPTCMSRDTGSYLYVTVTRGPTCMSRYTGSYLYVTVTQGATCRSQWHWVVPGRHSDIGSYLYVTVTRGPTCMSRDIGSYLDVLVIVVGLLEELLRSKLEDRGQLLLVERIVVTTQNRRQIRWRTMNDTTTDETIRNICQ